MSLKWFLAVVAWAEPCATDPNLTIESTCEDWSPQTIILTGDNLRCFAEKQQNSEYLPIVTNPGSEPLDANYLPGSIFISTDDLEGSCHPTLRNLNFGCVLPNDVLLPKLAAYGISRNSKIIVYSFLLLPAYRVAWTLLYAGVSEVHVLDGGITTWELTLQGPTSHTLRRPSPVIEGFGSSVFLRPELNAATDLVQHIAYQGGSGTVADTRSVCEFEGKCMPYTYMHVKGRILGAKFGGNVGGDQYSMDNYFDENNRMRQLKGPGDTVQSLWKRLGTCQNITEECIFYCGTGWRSAAATLVAMDLGHLNAKNYDGGWLLYSAGDGLAVATTRELRGKSSGLQSATPAGQAAELDPKYA